MWSTLDKGAILGGAILFCETANIVDTTPSKASPEISEVSQEPHPCNAFANMDARARNKRSSPCGAQVDAATRSLTTASSVFKFIYSNSFNESLIKRFCAEVTVNTDAIAPRIFEKPKPSLSTENEIRHGICVCNVRENKRTNV